MTFTRFLATCLSARRGPALVRTAARRMAALTAAIVLGGGSRAAIAQSRADASKAMSQVPTIGAVHAKLFMNKKSEWSEDVLSPTFGGSWNSVAGPNAANATLVIVDVGGPPEGTFTGYFGPSTRYKVRLLAKEGKRTLLDQSQVIPVLDSRGRVSVAFLFHHGGCVPVHLTASIVGARASSVARESLNFACGE